MLTAQLAKTASATFLRREPRHSPPAPKETLGELLQRYSEEVTPTKKGAFAEKNRIRILRENALCALPATDLTPQDFQTYRDARLNEVGPRTVSIELSLFSIVFKTANRIWGLAIDNPLAELSRPVPPAPRNRRLTLDEEVLLITEARSHLCRAEYLAPCIVLALETGLLAGEIVNLQWADISCDLTELWTTGNPEDDTPGRKIPLSSRAAKALRSLKASSGQTEGRVCHFYDSSGMGRAFTRACKRAGIENLHFQDLRNEAAWRLAQKLPVQRLMRLLGLRTRAHAQKFY